MMAVIHIEILCTQNVKRQNLHSFVLVPNRKVDVPPFKAPPMLSYMVFTSHPRPCHHYRHSVETLSRINGRASFFHSMFIFQTIFGLAPNQASSLRGSLLHVITQGLRNSIW